MDRIEIAVTLLLAGTLSVACKSDDENKIAPQTQQPAMSAAASKNNAMSSLESKASSSIPEKNNNVTTPAENSGHIVYKGKKTEVRGKDFAICETVNPGIKGDFNVITKLSNGTKFRLMGNVNEDNSAAHRGMFIGSMPNEVRAKDFKVKLDGRTLSGSAKTKDGLIEFSFEC